MGHRAQRVIDAAAPPVAGGARKPGHPPVKRGHEGRGGCERGRCPPEVGVYRVQQRNIEHSCSSERGCSERELRVHNDRIDRAVTAQIDETAGESLARAEHRQVKTRNRESHPRVTGRKVRGSVVGERLSRVGGNHDDAPALARKGTRLTNQCGLRATQIVEGVVAHDHDARAHASSVAETSMMLFFLERKRPGLFRSTT